MDATSQYINIVKSFLTNQLGCRSSMSLIVSENNQDAVLMLLESLESLHVIVSVHPTVGE